jgi:L,D-transpeptidase catalytic domain
MEKRGTRQNSSVSGSKLGLLLAISLVLIGLAVWFCRQFFRPLSLPAQPRTVEQVLGALAPAVERRIRPAFDVAGVSWPPRKLTLLAFKAEKRLELYASEDDENPRFVLTYPILASSGTSGPKLREGDRQVPEGFYRIELLNPNSRYHLSLRVNYPNSEDIERARQDGRPLANLGGDIMIHGGAASAGCLAIGDPAIEELFCLVARVGLDNVQLVMAPWDFRREKAGWAFPTPPAELDQRLREALKNFPLVAR